MKTVLFAMSILLILISGCETFNHSKKSREVTFGVRTYSSLATKTVYSGEGLYDNNGKLTLERINWLNGDKIRIYSPEVVRRFSELNDNKEYHWADYSIVGSTIDNTVNNGRSSQAKLQPLNNDVNFSTGNGLFWSDELKGQTASFYAVYPAPADDDVSGLVETSDGWAPAGAKGTISCSLPGTQAFSEKGNMGYAYMTACAPNVDFEDNVDLKFYPAYTAFEFHLAIDASDTSVDELYFGDFQLLSTESSLFGDYSVICNTSNPDNPAYTCPAYSDEPASAANNCITVHLNGYKLVKSGEGNTELVFTVFALPQDLNKLSMSIEVGRSAGNYIPRTLDFKKTTDNVTSWLKFDGCKKHIIKGLAVKGGSTWRLQVDDLPWDLIEKETTFSQNIQAKAFNIQNFTENIKPDGSVENHYYPEGTKDYQVRTLDMGKTYTDPETHQEISPYFEVTFRPMAPMGGYWQLIPESNGGLGTAAFQVVVWDEDSNRGNPDLKGHIMNQDVTLRVICNVTDDQRTEDHAIIIKGLFSTSVSFDENSTFSADSELQDVHKDGSFSYWRFVIPAKQN